MPTVCTDEQREFAREWLSGKVTEEALAYILGGLGSDWVPRGRETVDPQTWSTFWRVRQSWIVRRAEEWLEAHRLPCDRLVRTQDSERTRRGRRPEDTGTRERPFDGMRDEPGAVLRDRLHAVIERMTLGELCELRIPARFLIEE